MHLAFTKVGTNLGWECIMTLTDFVRTFLKIYSSFAPFYTEYKMMKRAASKRFTKNLFAETFVEGGQTYTVLHMFIIHIEV